MKRVLTLAALATISACATGSSHQEMRREAIATASPSGPGVSAVGPDAVAVSGTGRFARPSLYNVDGRVTDVEGAPERTVRIQRDGKEKDLRIADDTRVLRDGREVQLGDVHEGDEVRATFEVRGETPTATELRVSPAPEAK
jgi:hypothetical protein